MPPATWEQAYQEAYVRALDSGWSHDEAVEVAEEAANNWEAKHIDTYEESW
jgi:hypothetical protein